MRFKLTIGLALVAALTLLPPQRRVYPILDKALLDPINLAHADPQDVRHVFSTGTMIVATGYGVGHDIPAPGY